MLESEGGLRGSSAQLAEGRWDGLIRAGKFIEFARERLAREEDLPKTNPEPYRWLFPIPQAEIDANPALEQNPGYGGV